MTRHHHEAAAHDTTAPTSIPPRVRPFARLGGGRLRRVLTVGAAALVAPVLTTSMALGQANSSGPKPSGPKPTVVLVHGAFADASGWSAEIRQLRNDGYPVLAPANPLRGIASDAAYLRSVLATISGPIVLVGHSYGGAVITNAASGNPNVKALVYVAAFAPDEGETLAEAYAGSMDSLLTPDALDIRPYPLPGGGTGADAYIKVDRFRTIFAADLPTRVTDVMAVTQRPLDASVLEEPTHDPAWKTIPSWYLLPSDDRVIGTDVERVMAERAGSEIVEVRASHAVLVSKPHTVTRLIEQAARATAGR
ncbi:Pimeloyl-ACP methyl ester carboxylesterase [Jiangella sp. DSM 45060]|nr:Pimeloyl-ACP methyl ester carboxylesterase [Jiangella sp. DSM 45060]